MSSTLDLLQVQLDSYHTPDRVQRLNKNHFSLSSGSIGCLLGLSGVGKTTLLRVLIGLAPGRVCGTVSYLRAGNAHSPMEARAAGLIGLLAHEAALLPWLTVHDNLVLPSLLNPRLLSPTPANIANALDRLGIPVLAQRQHPHEMSFGMRQRIALARALIYEPPFLLIDELFTGLDTANAALVANILQEYVRSKRAICLCVTHDILRAIPFAHVLFYLAPGGTLTSMNGTSQNIAEALLERFHADRDVVSSHSVSQP